MIERAELLENICYHIMHKRLFFNDRQDGQEATLCSLSNFYVR
jgi:hypothetical protein